MRGRRQQGPALSSRTRWAAGATGLAVAGTALAVALVPAGAAQARPSANYHPGSDKAVFTVTGVEDSNCLVSTGGSTVYIKPGDRIDFSTGLAGVSLNGLDLQGGQIAGLDVKARIDGGTDKGGRTLSVPGGKKVKVKGLSNGTHTLAWSAKSVRVTVPKTIETITKKVPIIGGIITKVLHKTIPAHILTLPLSSARLKSGADLSWTGHIYVTKNAAQCTISVQTPKTKISAGPAHVTVPGQNVTVPGVSVPTKVSGVPSLGSSGGSKGKTSTPSTAPSSSVSYQPPALTVPQMVVPQGGGGGVYTGGGGYQLGLGTDNGTTTKLTNGTSGSSTSTGSGGSSTASGAKTPVDSTGPKRTLDLASNNSGSAMSGTLPVLLAIIAVIVLAMVAGTYARLYLLGRRS